MTWKRWGFAACTVVLAAVLGACSDASGGDQGPTLERDSAGVRIVEIIHPTAVPTRWLELDAVWMNRMILEIGRLGDVVPLSEDRVVVLDEMNGSISVLDPTGRVLLEFGRRGEGPGEFSPHGGISRVLVTDSSFLVPDIQLQRITEFSLDGEFLRAMPMPQPDAAGGPVFGVDWRAHPSGGIVFRAHLEAGDLVLLADGSEVETLYGFDRLQSEPNRLLSPTSLWDVTVDGDLLIGRSDRGRIERLRPPETSPLWIARWEAEGAEVTPGERSHLEGLIATSAEAQGLGSLPAEQLDRMLRSVTFPDSVPVIASVLADPTGRAWVQRAAPILTMGLEALRVGSARGIGGNEWWVLGPDGHLEEVVTLPRGFTPLRFHEDCMVGFLEDGLGVQRPARVCGIRGR